MNPEKVFCKVKDFDEVLQDMALGHPKYSMEEIVERMWGGDKIQNRTKLLYRMLNPNDSGANLKASDLFTFMRATENTNPIHYLAQKLGLVIFKLPPTLENENYIDKQVAKTVKEFGHLLSCLAEARNFKSEGGNFVTENEAAIIRKEGYKTIQAITIMMNSLSTEGDSKKRDKNVYFNKI